MRRLKHWALNFSPNYLVSATITIQFLCEDFKQMNITKTSFRAVTALVTAVATITIPAAALAFSPYGKSASSAFNSGDTVVLNQPVEIGAGSRIYIQGGKAKPRRDVHESEPYCYFSLYRSSAVVGTPVSIDPDDFNVSGTSDYFELVQLNAEPYQIAQSGFSSRGASEKTLITRIKISSASQPQVVGLHCGIWAVANERDHVSLEEVKNTLGDLVTLNLAKR